MKKEKRENYYYSKAQIDRNRIIEIITKSRKPLYQFEIKELIDKVWLYGSQLLGREDEQKNALKW
jgi:hypothetical protein